MRRAGSAAGVVHAATRATARRAVAGALAAGRILATCLLAACTYSRDSPTPLLVLTSLAATAVGANAADSVRISHPPLDEISGLVRSQTWPDTYWVHNDGGDRPRLFAVHADGTVIMPPYESDQYRSGGPAFFKTPWPGIAVHNAANIDWEDLALADGRLYIADVGNNANARRDLGVYVVPEPNPEATGDVRAQQFIPVRYPDQTAYPGPRWHFDCEALFVDNGVLYFLTKHRKRGQLAGWEPGTRLYRLDTLRTDQVNVLTLVAEHPGVTLVTAADLSPDGSQLAVLTYARIWVFARPASGDNWLASPARVLDIAWGPGNQVEALTWQDDQTLLVAGESRALFTVPLARLRSLPAPLAQTRIQPATETAR